MAHVKSPLHGGNIYDAARALDCDPGKIIDFSASINPLGPSPHVWRAIASSRNLLGHYPDPDCRDLRRALATFWRMDPDQIVVGNGSTELIDALPRALKIHRLLVVQPTFSEYASAMGRSGGETTALYAERTNHYAIPVDRLWRVMETGRNEGRSFDGVVLCHPNSPTGQACTADDLIQLAKVAHRRGLWLIVDESFADYCSEKAVLPSLSSWPYVVVLRSMTKFYALPGLRVGYAVSARTTAERLRRQLPPWSVSVMGQVAALAALNDKTHARKSLKFMTQERERFRTRLAALPGCTVLPTHANYCFVELPRGQHARALAEHLRGKGLLIRDCSSVPGANSRSIRLAVRTRSENDRLLRELSRLLPDRGSR
ncbi:MAG: threonine-phosphate decarboxylase CobD [Nitrospira sp.]|nr:threonine-phosphate decarboxylase CobD [Nitrospira sp.]MDH4304031.1 threonine-phosphate decarboxylase CobD [Nitrospira sp.]MDH5194002.1 threonine-phosphate decarboxylase CobD [Nitrospira sp.]